METSAETAVLVYLVLSGRLCGDGAGGRGGATEDEMVTSAVSAAAEVRSRGKEKAQARRHGPRWPERAQAGWGEAVAGTAKTVRFAYGETLGKLTLGELAFGINYYMRQQRTAPTHRHAVVSLSASGTAGDHNNTC